jgi:tetratricopeptide (TPR) repeat protein
MSKSDCTAKVEQASAHSKGAIADRPINMQILQDVHLIWLDENSADCLNTIAQLQCTTNNFTDCDQCIDFLTDIHSANVCMIISSAFCQHLVPLVHDITHLQAIFIFCSNKTELEQWAKGWRKVKGVFTEISAICKAFEQATRECHQNAIPISIMGTDGDVSKKNLGQLDPSFMYTQIMKEILLTIKFELHNEEFFTYCRDVLANNKDQLENMKKFGRNYLGQTPISWYASEGFLYPMLNRALRLMDAELIIKFGFFIRDLHRQIEQLHKVQFDDPSSKKPFTVYRGQGMDEKQFEKMATNKNGLLSFNCFLSTSKDRDVSLLIADSNSLNPDMIGVLFVLTIDPTQSTTPFASIDEFSCFPDEKEVLFSMHTVFRIGDITAIDENPRLFQVELTLTSDNDQDLRGLTDRIREETFPDSPGWYRLGLVLLNMGHLDRAQRLYEILLERRTEESGKAPIYHQLGRVKYEQEEYEEAIRFYEKSIEIEKKCKPLNHRNLTNSYNNIGAVYHKVGDYPKALSSYEEALAIQQKSLPPNYPDLANSYNNIGAVYQKVGDYLKAFSFYEKALSIKQQSLPPTHPYLASSYNNIGVVYDDVGEYPKALSFYQEALSIQQKSLPPNHPDLASSYNNIGLLYEKMGNYSEALLSFEKLLAIQQQSLPPDHSSLAISHYIIGFLYEKIGNYSEAILSFEKLLAIQQQTLPTNHPDFASSYNNIGLAYCNMDDYPKALSSFEKALAIQQQSLSPNHPSFASSYNNIGLVYCNMGDYPKALSSFENELAIQQQSLPPHHPSLAISHYIIGLLYEATGKYSKACSSCQRAVEIGQKTLPSNHIHLRMYQEKLAHIKKEIVMNLFCIVFEKE